jgi:hypothetical protein
LALTSCRDGDKFDRSPFRIVELSYEAGQLIVGVALEILCQLEIPLDRVSSEASSVLWLLSHHSLCGYDRNPLAATATQCVFDLVTRELAGRRLPLRQLHTGNSLLHIADFKYRDFDAVINNPPWGEKTSVQDRTWIRKNFRTTCARTDTYIAFVELGINLLRPDGIFAFVIPSQFVAARNAAELRSFLARETCLEHLILLPRAEFSEAAVRAAVLVGRRVRADVDQELMVTLFPFRYDLTHRGPARSDFVAHRKLDQLGRNSWWPLLAKKPARIRTNGMLRLSEIARLTSGIILSELEANGGQNGAADHFQAIRGRNFKRLGPVTRGILFQGESVRLLRHRRIADNPRVFVRELLHRKGQMCATVAPRGILPLHGVLTLVCSGIKPAVAAALLSSTVIAAENRRSVGNMSKVDFQRITLAELGNLPVARELCSETEIAARVDSLARRALRSSAISTRASILQEIDVLLQQLYQKKGWR